MKSFILFRENFQLTFKCNNSFSHLLLINNIKYPIINASIYIEKEVYTKLNNISNEISSVFKRTDKFFFIMNVIK